MKVLVVKMSSLGDVIHTLPALTDAANALPGVVFDWVVEEAFADVPGWHPAVDSVIPVALRRWRKRPWRDMFGEEWRTARRALGREEYDAVVDAQGLLKSAWITRYARGPRYGMDRHSARERLASLAYDHRFPISRADHAITRLRALFALSLQYPQPDTPPDFGLGGTFSPPKRESDVVFFHGSARPEKLWPVEHWKTLTSLAAGGGLRVFLPWGTEAERLSAEEIACAGAEVLPRMDLTQLAQFVAGAAAHVSVDTGPGHLAAALNVPGVSLYGPTRPERVGTSGPGQQHICARSRLDGEMSEILPHVVWRSLYSLMSLEGTNSDGGGFDRT